MKAITMNWIKKTSLAVLFPALIFVSGCESELEGFEDNPNAATSVSIDQLFTATQVKTFFMHESYIARSACIWMEQMMGTDRQYSSLAAYAITESDHATEWNMVYLGGGLVDARKIQALADDAANPQGAHYKGMAQVLEALMMHYIAAYWGDAPYSEAVSTVTEPALDDQATIYAAIQTLLDDAISNLSNATAGTLPENDMLFGGDAAKWKAAAYTLKARLYMHWVEGDGAATTNAALAKAAAANGIAALSGSAKTYHTSVATETTCWYQFYISRDSYMTAGATLVNLLKANSDPRETIYYGNASTGDTVRGAARGENYDGHSYLGSTYFGGDASIDILSYEENLLILAEAEYLLGNEATAQGHLNSARRAAETKWSMTAGVLDTSSSTGATLMGEISEEKYVALFLNAEVWNDWKRNCYPALSTNSGVPGRFYYSDDERNANTNIPAPADQPARNDNDPSGCS